MKKIFNICMIGILCFCLVGCQKTTDVKNVEDTGKEKEESKEKTDFINDNDSYFIKIDGKKFSAGDKISELSSVGYNVREREQSEVIPANKYMIGAGTMGNSENSHIFSVTPFNTTASSIKVSEAVIGGVTVDYSWAKSDERSANFEVYGKIKLGSTEEEVKKVYGEPTSISDLTNSKTYRYESDEVYRNYKFTFDAEGKVSGMSWQNLVFNQKK